MELCDQYLHELIKINPTINDFFLKEDYFSKRHIQPNIYSEDFYKELHQLDKKYLKIIEKKKEQTFYDKILLRDIKYNIHMETQYNIYMYIPINQNNNLLIEYVTECNGSGLYQFKKRKDYVDFMKRLKVLPQVTEEIILKMKNGINNKVCLPRRTVDKMIENIQDILTLKLYKHLLKNKLKPKDWDKTVEKYLSSSLQKLLTFLMNEYYLHTDEKIGLCAYKNGKDAYQKIIQYETFDAITPKQVYDLGWMELKRINKEKERLEKKLDMKNIKKYMDGKEIITRLKKIRSTLQTTIFPRYFHGTIKDKDLYRVKKVKPVDKHMFAYYVPPNLKGTNKGVFYINTTSVNQYELYVLSLHEGIPGHHFEITYHNNLSIPDYIKLGNTGYSEGWGLYCENLGDYKDNYEYYFKLQYEIQRSLRLIIDTGIHFFGWTYEKCFQLMRKHLTYPDEQIHNEIIRYMDQPGQAITYKLGEKAFLYVRETLLRKGYNIKDIHQIMLDIGPCPIEFLVNAIN
tara:strand:- start:1087 stop:2628 length:1542 start_codon:yes stop_codon:yes gene_type:complete